MTDSPQFDEAMKRLVRCMALANATLAASPPVMVFALAIPPLLEAAADVQQMIIDGVVADTEQIVHDPQALGPAVTELIAGATSGPTPDTLPEDWK